MINYNMRCIEIRLEGGEVAGYEDKLQHEMY